MILNVAYIQFFFFSLARTKLVCTDSFVAWILISGCSSGESENIDHFVVNNVCVCGFVYVNIPAFG